MLGKKGLKISLDDIPIRYQDFDVVWDESKGCWKIGVKK